MDSGGDLQDRLKACKKLRSTVTRRSSLIQICDAGVNFLFHDVLHIVEDCCMKVTVPSVSAHLFYERLNPETVTKRA